ncbi:unnamed protein product [Closterium sp. Yama58-4]|nr:unnamed protein product [Closterium sp. Yama58-4]
MSSPIITTTTINNNPKIIIAFFIFSLLLIAASTNFFTSNSSHSYDLPIPVKIYGPDEAVLLSLKSHWTGFQYADSWIEGTNCSTWHGVYCDSTSGAVTDLDLTSTSLNGTIPPAIGNLTALTSLVFKGNTLTGTLPSSIGLLTRLQTLFISDNGPGLRGSIPAALSRLSNLDYLDLPRNRFSGPIPEFILGGTMKKLISFDLSANRLTGSIPGGMLSGLSGLKHLGIADNRLTGSIPTEIGKLTALRILLIDKNRLEGPLPSSLKACTGLKLLAAGDNRLGGLLPVNTLLQLTQLESLFLHSNGIVVTSLASLVLHPTLRNVELSLNKVAPRILATVGRMKSIEFLNLSRNGLSGSVPASLLAYQPKLRALDLSFNRLSGSFPWTELRGAPELVWLSIQSNMLSGRVPEDPFKGLFIYNLNMSNNFFGGCLPNFGMPDRDCNLDASNNFFSGRPEIQSWGKRVCPIEVPDDDYYENAHLNVSRNCLSPVPGCNVTPQRRPASCAAFCGTNGKSGACGGHGTCQPTPVGGKTRWRFSCVCDDGYSLKAPNVFVCERTAAAMAKEAGS